MNKSWALPILAFALATSFIFTPIDEAYAHAGHEEKFNLGYALQDLHQSVVGWFSSEAKAELIAEHLAQAQMKAEDHKAKGKDNSDANVHDNESRVKKLQDRLELDVKPSVAQLVTEVTLSGELGKINELHDDFLEYRADWFEDFKMPDYSTLKNFESDVNGLQLAEKYCQNIVASTLIKASEPYTEYLVDQCPPLEDVSPGFVKSVFSGANSDE